MWMTSTIYFNEEQTDLMLYNVYISKGYAKLAIHRNWLNGVVSFLTNDNTFFNDGSPWQIHGVRKRIQCAQPVF